MRGRAYSWAATYRGGTHPSSQTQGATSCGSSSRDQRAVKTNVGACQRKGPPKISHPSTGARRPWPEGPALMDRSIFLVRVVATIAGADELA